jgi:hypothetical protein
MTMKFADARPEAILERLPKAQASARTDELPIIGHIPLPKPRPIPR